MIFALRPLLRRPLFYELHARSHRRRSVAGCTPITAEYVGRWTIVRSIVDYDRTMSLICRGSALLQVQAGTVLYEEAVSFEIANKPLRATRGYRFTSLSDGTIFGAFRDGAPFFRLRLDSAGTGSAVHRCGGDLYTLTLALRDRVSWQTRWDVSGTKHLRIDTQYAR